MAIGLLQALGSGDLAADLRRAQTKVPDITWLKHMVERHEIHVKQPQEIDQYRREHCNNGVIRTFFERFELMLNRDPMLILNCDETHISSRKRFKILVPDGKLALKQQKDKLPHFSAMCTISASGTPFRPMIILPESHKLPKGLNRFEAEAYFASTNTGWMTQHCFLIYVHFLMCELVGYGADLPPELRGQTMLLLLDGHSSRWTFEAMVVLRAAGIDVVVLPAHCTHVMQAFDVCVASPLKAALTYYLNEFRLDPAGLAQLMNPSLQKKWLAQKREQLVDETHQHVGPGSITATYHLGLPRDRNRVGYECQ
jgi:hypothetical protein